MHFDALTLAAVTTELRGTILPGRVQQVLMVDGQSIGMEIYAGRLRQYLLLAMQPTAARIYLAPEKLRRGTTQQPPLYLLLRKYVRGSALTHVIQPDPAERVLRLEFDHPEHGATTLVAEPMGRAANLILLDHRDRIRDCLRRTHADDGSRALMPGSTYTMPPQQPHMLSPVDDGTFDYYARLQQILAEPGPLWRILVRHIVGVSPSVAREVAWRAVGDTEAAAQDTPMLAVAEALQGLWTPAQNGAWTPGIWIQPRRDGSVVNADTDQPANAPSASAIVGFSPYEAHVKGRFVATTSISAAMAQFYAATAGSDDTYAGQRHAVIQALDAAVRKVERRLAAIQEDAPAPGEIDELRTKAEWLLALNSQIEPGQTELVIPLDDGSSADGSASAAALHIALDTTRSPVEQAQRLFQRAAKLTRAGEFIPKREARLRADLAQLEQLRVDLTLAENQPEIAAVQDELRAMGLTPGRGTRKRQGDSGQPLHFRHASGVEIFVGRNARQNEIVTFKLAVPDDLWLHARNVPGAHVVVRRAGREPSPASIQAAAQLAAYYSKARGERNAGVMLARRRFVSRLSGGHVGQVSVRNEESLTVAAVWPDGITQI